MRKLARRLFTLCSAVSLLLWVVACVLWARSHLSPLRWGYDGNTVAVAVIADARGLALSQRVVQDKNALVAGYSGGFTRPGAIVRWGFGHFAYQSYGLAGMRFRSLMIPLGQTAVLTSVLPLSWLYLRRRWSRQRLRDENRCLQCGYDLRASPERCPECGTPARLVKTGGDA